MDSAGEIKIEAVDHTKVDSKKEPYKVEWSQGFESGTGKTGTAKAKVRKPRATLDFFDNPPPPGTCFAPGDQLKLTVKLDKGPFSDTPVKINGNAIKPFQGTIKKRVPQESFSLELVAQVPDDPKIKIETLDGFDIDVSRCEKSVPLKAWTMAFAKGDPNPAPDTANHPKDDHDGLFFPGDHLIFKVKVSETPTIDEKAKIGLYRPNSTKAFIESNEFTISKAAQPPTEGVKIEIDLKKIEDLRKNETITAKIHSISGNCRGEKEENRTPLEFPLSALPVVRFAEKGPVAGRSVYKSAPEEKADKLKWIDESGKGATKGEDRKSLNPDFFKLYSGTKHKIKVTRDKAPKLESEVILKGPCLKNDVTVIIPEKQQEAEAEVELKALTPGTELVSFVKIEGKTACSASNRFSSLNFFPASRYLYIEGDWLTPMDRPCAPGDQIWIRLAADVERDFETSGPDGGAVFATIKCDALAEIYDVVFKKPNAGQMPQSEYATKSYPPQSKKGGIRIPENIQDGSYPIEIVGKQIKIGAQEKTIKFEGKKPTIEVLRRYGFFSNPHALDDVLPGDTGVSIALGLAHPARTHTAFVVKGPYCSKQYKVSFKPGQSALNFKVDFDIRPASDQGLSLELEPFSGNVVKAAQAEVTQKYPPTIVSPKPDIQAGFDKNMPIQGTLNYASGIPYFSMGAKIKLNVVLTDKAWSEESIVSIKSAAFYKKDPDGLIKDENNYELIFKKGERRREIEVALANPTTRESKFTRIEIEPATVKYARKENGEIDRDDTGRAKTTAINKNLDDLLVDNIKKGFLKQIPIIIIEKPEVVFGAAAQPDRHWIDTVPGLPFVVNERAKVFVSLARNMTASKEIKGKIVSPVIKGEPEFTIPGNTREPAAPIEVQFCKMDEKVAQKYFVKKKVDWGENPIGLTNLPERSDLASGPIKWVQVYEKRYATFPPHNPVDPEGPFVIDDEATIKVQLNHPAPKGGASVELAGPFKLVNYKPYDKEGRPAPAISGNKIEIGEGYDHREVIVKMNQNESASKDNVKLSKPNGCELGQKGKTLTLLVKTPQVQFDQETWKALPETRQAISPGAIANLPLMLDGLCPSGGCRVYLECDLFLNYRVKKKEGPLSIGEETKKYAVRFAASQNRDGKNRTTIDVPIDPRAVVPASSKAKIKFSDNHRCKLPSPAEEEVAATDPPTISFAKKGDVTFDPSRSVQGQLKPSGKAFYEAGVTAKIAIKPNRNTPADEGLPVRIRSSVFGAIVYGVTIPKKTKADTETEVEITLTNGKPANRDGTVPSAIIYLDAPEGWIEDGNQGALEVRVKAPDPQNAVVDCPAQGAIDRADEQLQPKKQYIPMEEYPDEYCNLKRLLLVVRHGDQENNPCKRGPFENGKFEIVKNVEGAEKPDKALICSGNKAPKIQVIADHPFGNPHVKDPRSSPHATNIIVGLDRLEKHDCPKAFIFDTRLYKHPFLFAADRSVRLEEITPRGSKENLDLDSTYKGLLGPSPGVADGPQQQGAPRETVFHTRLANAKDQAYEFKIKPPSRVLYPYKGVQAAGDAQHKFLDKSGTDASDLKDSDSKATDKALDQTISSGCLQKIADIEIHLGRNGNAFNSKENADNRKALHAILSSILVIVDMINKAGDGPTAAFGFGFSCKLTFLRGHYVRYWGWKECSDQHVFWWNHNCIDMRVLGITLEFLFGVGVGTLGRKIQAVIFGKITGELDIHREFEKQEPGTRKQAHVEKWADVTTKASIGVSIVIGDLAWFQAEAAVKTGYTFRFRTETDYGVDLEGYFNGLSAYAQITLIGFFDKKVEYTFIKGNVAGWPQFSITLGGKRNETMTDVNRFINQGVSRLNYIRNKWFAHLQEYQNLQLMMVADKKRPGDREYPLTAVVPGYRYEEGGLFANPGDWDANLKKWAEQWKSCMAYFRFETDLVQTRKFPYQSYKLGDRLERRVKKVESLCDEVSGRLKRLDALESRFEKLQQKIAEALDKSNENLTASEQESFLSQAERLRDDDAIDYRKIQGDSSFGNTLETLGDQVVSLHYYALKRRQW